MKIDLDWIQKELDAGREVELECVDSIRFLGAHHRNQSILKVGRLVVSSVDDTGVYLKDCFPGISPGELKYFRIKRSAPTFDSLMDAAVKARKEGHIGSLTLNPSEIVFKWGGNDKSFSDNEIDEGISFFDSLYTETFVIGKLDDLKKINLKNSVVKFLNGFESQIKSVDWQSDGGNISLYDGEFYVDFDIIKGATVTQKRG